jgi:hypothetical protein
LEPNKSEESKGFLVDDAIVGFSCLYETLWGCISFMFSPFKFSGRYLWALALYIGMFPNE